MSEEEFSNRHIVSFVFPVRKDNKHLVIVNHVNEVTEDQESFFIMGGIDTIGLGYNIRFVSGDVCHTYNLQDIKNPTKTRLAGPGCTGIGEVEGFFAYSLAKGDRHSCYTFWYNEPTQQWYHGEVSVPVSCVNGYQMTDDGDVFVNMGNGIMESQNIVVPINANTSHNRGYTSASWYGNTLNWLGVTYRHTKNIMFADHCHGVDSMGRDYSAFYIIDEDADLYTLTRLESSYSAQKEEGKVIGWVAGCMENYDFCMYPMMTDAYVPYIDVQLDTKFTNIDFSCYQYWNAFNSR